MAGTLVANQINTDTGLFSTNNAYLGIAKAWLNYNGSTQTVNGSFNVSSVTRNGSGDYTITFTNAMANIYYVVSGSCQQTITGNYGFVLDFPFNQAPTTTTARFCTSNAGSGATTQDFPYVSVVVHGA